MKIPKISCIVPVYNIEKYVARCLDSLINQTFKDIEIIVINDGSTDNSLAIIKEYAKKDQRIKFLTTVNQGLSVSRNQGLQLAQGEYIHFIDGDDSISLKAYESLDQECNFLDNKPLDVIIFDYYKVYEGGEKTLKTNKKINQGFYGTYEDKLKILSSGVVAWNKIYKRDFLKQHNSSFHPSIIYEDLPFFWKNIILSNNIFYSKLALYLYYQNKNSIMNSSLNYNKSKHIIKSMELVKEYLINTNNFNAYKNLFVPKLLKTFSKFFDQTKNNKRQLFLEMQKSLAWIDLKSYKKILGNLKYIKYSCLMRCNYILYRLFF
ncbi:Glycosyltransferase family 2 protein [Candidatus Hepatincolaceae symbiont of Richtersius coronifer]